MADEIDLAQQRAAEDLARRVQAARRLTALPDTGSCHNCDEPLEPGVHFCNADCRDDYQARKKVEALR